MIKSIQHNLLVIIFSLRPIPKFLHHLFYSLGNCIRTPLYWSCYNYLEPSSHWFRKEIEHTTYLQSPNKFRKHGELNFSRYCQGNFLLVRVSKYQILSNSLYQFFSYLRSFIVKYIAGWRDLGGRWNRVFGVTVREIDSGNAFNRLISNILTR